MYELGSKSSIIRELFMYGRQKAAEIGEENVYDFSLGSPSVPPPETVTNTLSDLLQRDNVHGYTPAAGHPSVRESIAKSINKRFGMKADPNRIYMTCGAAASLTCTIKALTVAGDEWIVLAPFFPEYKCFVESVGASIVVSQPNPDTMDIDFEDLEKCFSSKTKGLIINSPNNPSGFVYSEDTIKSLGAMLKDKSKENGHPIYLITDEPYREIVYGDVSVPYVPHYYQNTIVCYSYSKSFSLAGERIGYIYVSDGVEEGDQVFLAVCGAGRSMGFVCAPSIFQYVVSECVDTEIDISVYKENRDILYKELSAMGYHCIMPEGAFYLFVKTLDQDAEKFCEYAKTKYNLLLVPSNSFYVEGYMRISYCVKKDMILRSLKAFKQLALDFT